MTRRASSSSTCCSADQTSDMLEHADKRGRNLLDLERRDQQGRIALVPPWRGAEPAMELALDRPPAPRKLVLLKAAERLELALVRDYLLHAGGPERPDQLVLQVLDTHVGRVAEHPLEPALLGSVAQAGDALS